VPVITITFSCLIDNPPPIFPLVCTTTFVYHLIKKSQVFCFNFLFHLSLPELIFVSWRDINQWVVVYAEKSTDTY
jgi:hypothetical protein